MCLAVPSKIIEINDTMAKVDVDGVVRETSIMLPVHPTLTATDVDDLILAVRKLFFSASIGFDIRD